MAVVYTALKTPKNSTNGLADSFFLAPKAWFDEIACAEPQAGTATLATANVIAGPHTFTVGKGFIEMQCAPFKNTLAANTIGEMGSTSFDKTLTVFVPGSYEELHATMNAMMNQPLIVLVRDGNCAKEKFYQLGCDCKSAWMSASFKTGEGKGGQKGYEVTFNDESDIIAFYTGVVTAMPTTP